MAIVKTAALSASILALLQRNDGIIAS